MEGVCDPQPTKSTKKKYSKFNILTIQPNPFELRRCTASITLPFLSHQTKLHFAVVYLKSAASSTSFLTRQQVLQFSKPASPILSSCTL